METGFCASDNIGKIVIRCRPVTISRLFSLLFISNISPEWWFITNKVIYQIRSTTSIVSNYGLIFNYTLAAGLKNDLLKLLSHGIAINYNIYYPM
jgi:hypothetical protein